MLTLTDKGGRGGLVLPFLADIICEELLTLIHLTLMKPSVYRDTNNKLFEMCHLWLGMLDSVMCDIII